jgi:hypothetical protein
LDTPLDHAHLAEGSTVFRAGSVSLSVAGIPDLIRMKESAGRAQDRADVSALRRIQDLPHE